MKFAVALMALLLLSCSVQENDYCHKRVDGFAKGDAVELLLNMDSTSLYNLYFCVTLKADIVPDREASLPLRIKFVSPNGSRYADTVVFPINVSGRGTYSRSVGGLNTVEWLYLQNIRNSEPGLWRLFVEQNRESHLFRNLTGIGVRTEKIKWSNR